jgi:NADH-quinone oxidoreductase subunit J
MPLVAFVIVAAIAVGSALGLILKKYPIHGALFLVVNLATIAACYLMLGAALLAMLQVIVYAGAIMVLFLFAIFTLIPGKEETGPDPQRRWRLVALPFGGLLLVMVFVAAVTGLGGSATPAPDAGREAEALGRLLLTDYLFPFELTSVLLLAAMVGVLILARRKA